VLTDMSRMRAVAIDPGRRRARIEAGAQWQHIIGPAAEHGLAGLSGSAPDVCVTGYALGGGASWMIRRYGFAANSIRAAELVTAERPRSHATRSDRSSISGPARQEEHPTEGEHALHRGRVSIRRPRWRSSAKWRASGSRRRAATANVRPRSSRICGSASSNLSEALQRAARCLAASGRSPPRTADASGRAGSARRDSNLPPPDHNQALAALVRSAEPHRGSHPTHTVFRELDPNGPRARGSALAVDARTTLNAAVS
jgi:FAD/FMN-containing dehydrogenase